MRTPLFIRRILQSLGAIVLGAIMSGCAFTKDYVTLQYTAQPNPTKVAGAENARVAIAVTDSRSVRDRIGSKKNGYGMEAAAIISSNDVAQLLSQAIETELTHRGFQIQAGAARVEVELNKCLNDFKMGFWSGDSIAELIMNVQVKKADGSILYTRLVNTEGKEPAIQVAGGNNARIAVERALQNAVQMLTDDARFTDALLNAGRFGPAPGS